MKAKMRKLVLLFLLLTSINNLNAQSEEQVINEILIDLFDPFQELFMDTIFIVETKMRTYFYDYEDYSYEYINGFTIPSNIISEWKKNIEKQDSQTIWDEECLNKKDTIFVGKDTVITKKPVFKCLSESEIKLLAEYPKPYFTNQKQIYSVGQIIFDNSRETAIFRFMGSSGSESARGCTVLIKKVFGKWVIITRFDYWIT